jgi:hypothetical protein
MRGQQLNASEVISMKDLRGPFIACLVLLGSGLLSGCNVEKARAIQGAAVQFKAESLSAIQAIDDMHRQELEPPPRATAEIRQEFVSGILNSKREINSDLIDLAIDPFKPPTDSHWDTFISDLRGQYETFSAIFNTLDSGNLVAVDEVRQSAEHARNLTVQMALFADAISKNPPVLYRQRNAILVKLRKQRKIYQDIQNQIKAAGNENSPAALRDRLHEVENQVGEIMGEWQAVKQQEQKILEDTVAHCLKAAVLGKELGQLINRYDKLDLDQINVLIPRILNSAAAITGRDYSALQSRTTSIISEIREDPLWRDAANSVLDRVNNAATKRIQTQSALVNSIPGR